MDPAVSQHRGNMSSETSSPPPPLTQALICAPNAATLCYTWIRQASEPACSWFQELKCTRNPALVLGLAVGSHTYPSLILRIFGIFQNLLRQSK